MSVIPFFLSFQLLLTGLWGLGIAYFDQILGPHLDPKSYASFILAKTVGPIMKSASITYRLPTRYPDVVTVAVRVPREKVMKDRFTQQFIIVSRMQEKVVAEGECVVVTFDYQTQRKADIPREIVNAFETGEELMQVTSGDNQ